METPAPAPNMVQHQPLRSHSFCKLARHNWGRVAPSQYFALHFFRAPLRMRINRARDVRIRGFVYQQVGRRGRKQRNNARRIGRIAQYSQFASRERWFSKNVT